MNTVITIGLASSVLSIAAGAHAEVQSYLLGTDAPPDVIGGVQFTPFAPDTQPIFADVGSVALDGSNPPSGVTIGFSQLVSHRVIGKGWVSWGHGYTGDVYYTNGGAEVTMLMPANTQGFRFYAESNIFAVFPFTISATTDAGSTVMLTELIKSSPAGAAEGFAFLADAGELLTSITITTSPEAEGFAVGEFGIALVPAPATLALLGVVGLGRRRRRYVSGLSMRGSPWRREP